MWATLNFYAITFITMFGSSGLTKIWDDVRDNWIGPIFFVMIAVGAFMFLKNQQITKLILFLVVAAVVGVLIFGGDALFGKGKALTNMFQKTADNVGTSNSSGIGN